MAFFSSLSFFLLLSSTLSDAAAWVGVNYGRIADNLPSPDQVVELLKTQGIDRIKLYDTDSTVLTALSNSNISVVVALPNEYLSSAAADSSFTDSWVQSNISHFYPSTKIDAIAVGNEVFVDPNNTTKFLVPAMKNVYASLQKFNLHDNIKISSPIALTSLASSYPTSSGSFRPDLIEPVIKPMLDLIRQSQSYLMVNAYPFFAYMDNSDKISIDYALFRENAGVIDSGNGLKYSNLFEAQLDAVFAAMSGLKYEDVPVVVTETGWPSKGDEKEIGASMENAAAYNGNLVKRVLTGSGTPLRPKEPLNVYLFALFNENKKPGPSSERNYGLFYPNEEKVYEIPLTGGDDVETEREEERAPMVNGSKVERKGETWCVANGEVGSEKLQEGLDYACGEGGADCSSIQPGGTCYNPDSLQAHASFAFNSYYHKMKRASGTCYFGGAAYVVTQPPPLYGKCEFPTEY